MSKKKSGLNEAVINELVTYDQKKLPLLSRSDEPEDRQTVEEYGRLKRAMIRERYIEAKQTYLRDNPNRAIEDWLNSDDSEIQALRHDNETYTNIVFKERERAKEVYADYPDEVLQAVRIRAQRGMHEALQDATPDKLRRAWQDIEKIKKAPPDKDGRILIDRKYPDYGILFHDVLQEALMASSDLLNIISGFKKSFDDAVNLYEKTVYDAISGLCIAIEKIVDARLPVHAPVKISSVHTSTTKPDKSLWGKHGDREETKYITKRAAGGNIHVIVGLDFSAMENDPALKDAVRRLTPFDRDVFNACITFFLNGCNIFTISDIHHAMGKKSKPGKAEMEQIEQSIKKMSAVRIYLNNDEEIAAGMQYPRVIPRWFSVLPVEGVAVRVRGKYTPGYSLLKAPSLLELAEGRKQITQMPIAVLQSPNSKSEDVRLIEMVIRDYLNGMKRKTKKERRKRAAYTLEKLFYDCGLEDMDPKKRSRLLQYVSRYLDHLASCNFIHNWEWGESAQGKGKMLIFRLH